MAERKVSVSTVVDATPQQVFDLLADPAMHPVIDGSHHVRKPLEGAPTRLFLGAKFGMSMKIGVPYKITNTVVEFEEGTRIAWKHAGGHVWRWTIAPIDDATKAEVTEEFDWSTARSPQMIELFRYPKQNKAAMEKTLANLPAVLGAN